MQTQAKWISPPFSCWKCPLFVLLFFFYKKELTGLHFSVTDRKYSSISLKFQKYFFTQFSDFPNYWPRPGWPATAKKENLSNFAKKMFCRSGICSRQRFIHFICHLQSSRCNNTMNKLKMFVHQTKIFWENFKVFDCRWGGDKPPDWIGKLYNALGTTWSMEVLKTLSEPLNKIANNPKCLKIRNTNPVKFNQSKIGTNCAPNTLLGLGY